MTTEATDLNTLGAYDFELPERLIAQKPVEPRDTSRLLVVDRKTGRWEHRIFRDLPEYLNSGDALIANNTQVFKARLATRRVLPEAPGALTASLGGAVEVFLLERLSDSPNIWRAMTRASARVKPGFQVITSSDAGLRALRGEVIEIEPELGTVQIRWDHDPIAAGLGELPLPPYIERAADTKDESTYQTVYAREQGSVAAPTAGLHFTPELISTLKAKGIVWEEVTLHVGLGTFRPVKVDQLSEHTMHEEWLRISPEVAKRLNQTRAQKKGRWIAVGTTSVRTLESQMTPEGLASGEARTRIFIRPGDHEFKAVDALITNFHLPKSTLLMLVSAFAGRELIQAAYSEAVKKEYRFFSYGDAMLIL